MSFSSTFIIPLLIGIDFISVTLTAAPPYSLSNRRIDCIKINVMPALGLETSSRPSRTHFHTTRSLTSSSLDARAGLTAIASVSGCGATGRGRFVGFWLGTRARPAMRMIRPRV
jgi:hypothetical protein